MGISIGKVASIATKAIGKLDGGNLLSGLDINNVSPESISGIKSAIEGKLNGLSSSMMQELTSSITESDIESVVGNMDIESEVKKLMASNGLDGSSIDSSQYQSLIDSMTSNLSGINSM